MNNTAERGSTAGSDCHIFGGLADRPRTLGLDASLTEAIDMVADTLARRMNDDIVVDEQRRCQGVLRVGDLVRDLAQRQSKQPNRPPAPARAGRADPDGCYSR